MNMRSREVNAGLSLNIQEVASEIQRWKGFWRLICLFSTGQAMFTCRDSKTAGGIAVRGGLVPMCLKQRRTRV